MSRSDFREFDTKETDGNRGIANIFDFRVQALWSYSMVSSLIFMGVASNNQRVLGSYLNKVMPIMLSKRWEELLSYLGCWANLFAVPFFFSYFTFFIILLISVLNHTVFGRNVFALHRQQISDSIGSNLTMAAAAQLVAKRIYHYDNPDFLCYFYGSSPNHMINASGKCVRNVYICDH